MRAATSARRLSLMLVGVLVVLAGVTAAVFAAPAKPDFSLAISPASQSVQQGGAAAFTVTVQGANGYTGTVNLAVSGVPKGSAVSWNTSSAIPLSATNTTGTAKFTITTSTSTAAGTNTITVNGNSGNVSHLVTANLTVTQMTAAPFTMSATPGSATVAPGGQAVFSLTVANSSANAMSVTLNPVSAPTGPGFSFSPASPLSVPAHGATTTTMTVSTAANLATGDYKVTITGSSGGQSQTAAVLLTVATSGKAFGMSGGSTTGFAPGTASAPINIIFDNSQNSSALSVTNVTVTIKSVTPTATAITRGLTCAVSDYVITQYTGAYPLVVPAGSTTTSLQSLRIASASWPQISMLDSLSRDQTGCEGATVQLTFSGSGTGS